MTVSIIAFGIAKEILGGSSITMDIPIGSSVDQLKSLLGLQYPELKKLSAYMVALNNEYASAGNLINATDEIAIIPPVSGG